MQFDFEVNDTFKPLLNCDKRYLVLYGGAGSGKSVFIADRFLIKLISTKNCNLLVVRNVGKSNRDSTFALFKQRISAHNLNRDFEMFKINESDMRIRCSINSNEIIFAGLDDVEKLKSVTFTNSEVSDIWIEEASEVDKADFNQLDVRLRGKNSKKQMTLSFNPVSMTHWLKDFCDDANENKLVHHSTYKDNRFLDEDYVRLLESYKDTDVYYYDVYCLGNWGSLGSSIFASKKIRERLASLKEPQLRGSFLYDYDGLKITNIRWVNDENGYIRIYKPPEKDNYVIGGDTAGGESGKFSDFFVGQVLNSSGEQVATLRHRFDSDLYAKQMYCLGIYYRTALIGIEMNFDSYPIKELERLGYPNLYFREQQDTFSGTLKKAYGFRTDSVSRPKIISQLVEIVRDHTELFNDKATLEEFLTFVRNEKGRPEASIGAHDDCVMSVAIAHEVRSQIRIPVKLEVTYTEDNEFFDFGM